LSNVRGGKGRGGRGASRKTVQPRDIILTDVNLEYTSDGATRGTGAGAGAIGTKTLLQNASLKLLSGKIYALVGRNGCGKSSLLKRMSQKKIPGFTSLHLKILYIPQEVFEKGLENSDDRLMDVIIGYTQRNKVDSSDAASGRIEVLEKVMESLDLECPDTGPDNMVQVRFRRWRME
jgi:ATPase subunit of ABC transporter with duplicated ATPase domains